MSNVGHHPCLRRLTEGLKLIFKGLIFTPIVNFGITNSRVFSYFKYSKIKGRCFVLNLLVWLRSLAGQGRRTKGGGKKRPCLDITVHFSFIGLISLLLSLSFSFLFISVCISYAYLSLDSASWKRISFTLAALKTSNCSRTSKRVWGDEEAVISLCVLRRSRSSDIWRLCRVSAGLSIDYG